jgi:hypothetical protein
MHKDFKVYLEKGKTYFRYHKRGGELNIIRKKEDPHSNNTQSIDEIYGGELAPVIIKIAKNAIKTYEMELRNLKFSISEIKKLPNFNII